MGIFDLEPSRLEFLYPALLDSDYHIAISCSFVTSEREGTSGLTSNLCDVYYGLLVVIPLTHLYILFPSHMCESSLSYLGGSMSTDTNVCYHHYGVSQIGYMYIIHVSSSTGHK